MDPNKECGWILLLNEVRFEYLNIWTKNIYRNSLLPNLFTLYILNTLSTLEKMKFIAAATSALLA